MNIIHIGNIGLKANGVGQVISAITDEQLRLGHSVLALTVRIKKEELPIFKEIHSVSELSEIIALRNPDIIIFHSLYIWEYIKFYKYLIRKKIPYLIQLHGALSRENYKKSKYKKWIANLLFYNSFIKNAQRIIYLNKGEYSKSIVPKINPSSAIIPNGCQMPSHEYQDQQSDEKLEVLFIGRIDIYHKGLDILIKALQDLKDTQLAKEVHFSFYGIGEPEEVNSFISYLKPLEGFADFYGPAYGEMKNSAFHKAHIFILTSRSEGMPMAILEALSYGVPCIVTPNTNMSDVVLAYNCGWCTELESTKIANTISQAIIEYKTKKDYFKHQSIRASQQFSWGTIAERAISLYQDVINEYTLKK